MKLTLASLVYVLPSVLAICNPLTSGNCPPVPALGKSFKQDWSQEIGPYFEAESRNGQISFSESDGISLTINKQGDNPLIHSNFYIMFGKVEVVLRAAQGKGIISSFYLQSDDLDEIDIELFGGDNYEFQSNYFIKGSTVTYDRGIYHPVNPGPLTSFHTYTVEWTPDALTWSLDGTVVRTITKDNTQGYPQTPMQIIAGTWAGGDPNNAPGTIDWAGGLTDFSQAPFTMSMKSIIVSDYSSGKSYSYSGTSGTWQSIVAEDGEVNGRQQQGQQEFARLQLGGTIKDVTSSKSSSSSTTTSSTSSSSTSSSSTSSSTTSSSTTSSSAAPSSSASSAAPSSSSTVGSSTASSASSIAPSSTKKSETTSGTTSHSTHHDQTTASTIISSTHSATSPSVSFSAGQATLAKSSLLALLAVAASYLLV